MHEIIAIYGTRKVDDYSALSRALNRLDVVHTAAVPLRLLTTDFAPILLWGVALWGDMMGVNSRSAVPNPNWLARWPSNPKNKNPVVARAESYRAQPRAI
jgi:hypothetical protein